MSVETTDSEAWSVRYWHRGFCWPRKRDECSGHVMDLPEDGAPYRRIELVRRRTTTNTVEDVLVPALVPSDMAEEEDI